MVQPPSSRRPESARRFIARSMKGLPQVLRRGHDKAVAAGEGTWNDTTCTFDLTAKGRAIQTKYVESVLANGGRP
jgi:hypothetical protein